MEAQYRAAPRVPNSLATEYGGQELRNRSELPQPVLLLESPRAPPGGRPPAAQSGFGWDSKKNMVMVDSEEVWARYVEANKEAGCYRNKEVKHREAIQTIYSKDHATGAGARTGAELAQEQVNSAATHDADDTPDEVPPKRQCVGEAILSMIGEMRTSFDDALKTTEPFSMSKVTPPTEVLEAIQKVQTGLGDADIITCYTKLTADERSFESFTALPDALKKHYLLALLR